jgi:hypothetical protein
MPYLIALVGVVALVLLGYYLYERYRIAQQAPAPGLPRSTDSGGVVEPEGESEHLGYLPMLMFLTDDADAPVPEAAVTSKRAPRKKPTTIAELDQQTNDPA